jgi:general secretion pathway protein J
MRPDPAIVNRAAGAKRGPRTPTHASGRLDASKPGGYRHGRHGFTLLELLVAISIMAIVSIISWRGLSSLIATRDRLSPENDEVRSLLTGFGQMQLDLAQAVSPMVMPLGATSVRVTVIDAAPMLQILRLAAPQPDGASAIQRVVYSVQDGKLVRQVTAPTRSLAAAINAAVPGLPVIPSVTSIRVRVWRINQGWVLPADADAINPPGVEVELTRSDGTQYRRVMTVG